MELYPEKPEIENIMELYKPEIKNKQYSMSSCVIFSIMITTVILLIMCFAINDNDITTELDNPMQCIMPTFKNIVFIENYRATSSQIIDKYNKIKDLMINIAKHIYSYKNFNYKYV